MKHVGWGLAFCLALGSAANAIETIEFRTPGAPDSLRDSIRAASLMLQAKAEKVQDPQELFAAARADYGRILGALYADGYYSGVINILVDGREAAGIAPLDAPQTIRTVTITVTPGPRFRFSRANVTPLAPGTELPERFRPGGVAQSTAIVDAAQAGVDGWRGQGHAKAAVSGQSIQADHRAAQIAADIRIAQGPRVRFGDMRISGSERTLPRRIRQIAGFPTGEVFDPEKAARVVERLRRTGVFRSVVLDEAGQVSPDGTLDFDLSLVEDKKRRLGFGVDISSFEGIGISGYWLHRNLFRGAERLRIDGAVRGIDGETGGVDYSLGLRIDRPGTPFRDNTAFIAMRAEKLDEEDYEAENFSIGIGLNRVFSDQLTAEAGVNYLVSNILDSVGDRRYRVLEFPIGVTWDSRDNALDATEGFYIAAGAKPFKGFSGTGSGARLTLDARGYRAFGAEERFVLAGRFQVGSVLGSDISDTPRDYLFYSGGGGSVRGQPYQALGVTIISNRLVRSGGMNFLGLSGEMRAGINDSLSVVGFYDAGYVSAFDFFDDSGGWHSGAGVGLRYDTGIGPIRFDVAAPVDGNTGDGVQFYIGIGQAF